MRETRLYGSEGGKAKAFPPPIVSSAWFSTRGALAPCTHRSAPRSPRAERVGNNELSGFPA